MTRVHAIPTDTKDAVQPFAKAAEIIRPDLPDSTEIELRIDGERVYVLALGSLRALVKASAQ